jgi:ATP-dependent helicase HrpA
MSNDMSATVDTQSRGFRLCCTQPRRIAARSIAEHVSKEFQTQIGKKVGFRVGHRDGVGLAESKQFSDETEIEYVTEGLLLAQLRASPQRIKNYDIIIIDEAHERNIETDLLLSFLRNHLRRLKVTDH